MSIAAESSARSQALKRAIRLEAITLLWMMVEAAGALGAGIAAHSLLLIAFGADSIIELLSATLLYHRLRAEARSLSVNMPDVTHPIRANRSSEFIFRSSLFDMPDVTHLERRAALLGGYLLYALAICVAAESAYGLLHKHVAEAAPLGLIIAATAAFGMPMLARAKLKVAEKIGSKALRADAMESITCGYLSWVLLVGLAANAWLHLWWLDAVAALVLIPFLVKEAREAISGECGCCK